MAAKREILAFQEGSDMSSIFESLSAAESWARRVETWIKNLRQDLEGDSLPAPGQCGARWLLFPCDTAVVNNSTGEIHCQLCKKCRGALSAVISSTGKPSAHMPQMARANGLWRKPDPEELQRLSYCEAKVNNLARVYVSVKRVYLNRGSYAGTGANDAPLYHQRNVVAYPQNPDAALRSIGMSPINLAKMLQVQFVGSDRSCVRAHPDLQVSLGNSRQAFRWLSVNSWPFMEATRKHVLWESDKLDNKLEELLDLYQQSLGVVPQGVPAELVQGAAQILPRQARVLAFGPADCVAQENELEQEDISLEMEGGIGDQCAGIIEGGVDHITPIQIWDDVMK